MQPVAQKNYLTPTYQLIITAGIIILFLQLYSHAISMFTDSQTNAQVALKEEYNEQLRQQMREDIVESVALELDSIMVRRSKLEAMVGEGVKTLPGERVFIIANSDIHALENTRGASESSIFKDPEELGFDEEASELELIKRRPPMDQWKYVLFGIK